MFFASYTFQGRPLLTALGYGARRIRRTPALGRQIPSLFTLNFQYQEPLNSFCIKNKFKLF